jgi:neutral ceramidase
MARAPGSLTCRLVAGSIALSTAACGWNQQALPAPTSPVALTGTGSLRAGFGRADITPSPGVGLAGNGPEGLVSTGYRHRLYVRALVLEDPDGERIALVAVDQAHVSANLHRLAAGRLVTETGIGADRLIVSATHTHSGGSHFYGERQLNGSSARLGGYDPSMVDLIVSGIVSAVRQAYGNLRPAKAAWGFQPVKGFTRNRSYANSYCLNPKELRSPCPGELNGSKPDSLLRSVDTEWKLLRIDRQDAGGVYRPAGAYSVFAIHGTANPTVTTLLDGDIHAVVERRLEYLIDSMNGQRNPGYVAQAVHVLANGTEGDTSPNRPAETQCPLPVLRSPSFAGPRAPPSPWIWVDADSDTLTKCFAAARAWIDTAGKRVGDDVFENFKRLEAALTDQFPIRRAFATLSLPGQGGLCPTPVVGTSTAAGASDVPTRVAGWKYLGVIPSGFEQGGHAISKPPKGCQAEKKLLLGNLQTALIVGKHGLPDVAQLSLVQMGNVFLATLPAEPTTTTGRLIGDALTEAVTPAVPHPHVIVVALTNGFMQYVATRYEYAGQTYEGGSTIYGPATAEFFAANVAALGKALINSGPHSPPADVGPITAYPGKASHILPRKTATPKLIGDRVMRSPACLPGGELRVTWLDEPPGRLAPAEGQVLEILEQQGADWVPVAWDDQDDVVVRAVKRVKNKGFEWSVTLSRKGPEGSSLRLRLLPGHGQPEYVSESFPGCAGPPK